MTLSPSASSGLPVTLHSSDPTVCSTSGLTITALEGGTCTLSARQEGNDSWAAAADVERTASVMAPQSITFPRPADVALSAGTAALTASAGSKLPVTYAVAAGSSACSVSGSTVTLLAAGTCTVTASQEGNAVWPPASPETRTFAVTVPDRPVPPTPTPTASATPTPTPTPAPTATPTFVGHPDAGRAGAAGRAGRRT